MIMAAINPDTGEFLGLLIPKEDLTDSVTIHGTSADWEALMRGEAVSQDKVGVIHVQVGPGGTASVSKEAS